MKKILAAATIAALVGAAGAASAAEIYKGSTKDAPVYIPPPPTWTGFYVGAHIGGLFAEAPNHDVDGYAGHGLGYDWSDINDAVFGGGTIGYNFQTGPIVLGVEADFGGVGLNGHWNTGAAFPSTSRFYLHTSNDASFYADVTGRLGYAAGPALFYVKGGWAYLDSDFQVGGYNTVGATAWSASSGGLDGWTAGGGVEYLWNPSWSVKAEYLYFDFGNIGTHWFGYGQDWRFDRDLTINSFKLGINYHFNNIYTPLK